MTIRTVPMVLLTLSLGAAPALAAPDAARTRGALAGLAIPFVENQGQVDARVAYYAPTFVGTAFVTHRGELVYSLPAPRKKASSGGGWTLTETVVGGTARPHGQMAGATGVAHFEGHDRARWRPALSTYETLGLGEAWPGVTIALRARGRSVEKIFTVQPGASVETIRVRVGGADTLTVDTAGALVARTGLGPVTFTRPVAYQERDGVRREVAVAYRLAGREYGFAVGAYDRDRPLVIDPLLQSTYLGGSARDEAHAMAIHPLTGDVYVTGDTASSNFPGTGGGAQPSFAGAALNAFVARLDRTLTTLVQATYFGIDCQTFSLAIHPVTGDVYIGGNTTSPSFPGTTGGAHPTFRGGGDIFSPASDGFVARLDRTLTTLVQSTYVQSPDFVGEIVDALAIHPVSGDVYLAGEEIFTVFAGPPGQDAATRLSPVGPGNRPFVARYDAALTTDFNSFRFFDKAGAALGVAIDPTTGDVYIAGGTGNLFPLPGSTGGAQPTFGGGSTDAFVMRLPPTLEAPIQSTYLGGTGGDGARALAIDAATGDVYVAGSTTSTDFPGTAAGALPSNRGAQDAFVARLDRALTTLVRATYVGGTGVDSAFGVALMAGSGDVYVTGGTFSSDLPATTGAIQPARAGDGDAFIARFTSALDLLIQATYLGGAGEDFARAIAIHPATAQVYVAGLTPSTDFPGTAGGARTTNGGTTDAFVSRVTFGLAAVDPAFADILPAHPFLAWIEALARAGITGGCAVNPPLYCADDVVTRAQMAVFLERGVHGAGFQPSAATGVFADVPPAHFFAAWIEALARDGITSGCSPIPLLFCPEPAVTRAEMAVFILRARHGAGFQPPPASGVMFVDVRSSHPFATWIEQLAREGITGGCDAQPPRYCPDLPVTRGQMAVFLARAFGLPL